MIFPDFLKKGDKIAIVSPASAVNPTYIDGTCLVLEQWGYIPVLGKHCKGKLGYFSGTAEERINDFKEALFNPDIKAILCGRGGYGTIHLAEHISTDDIRSNPKWLIGFSDISVLHAMYYCSGVASIHASMAKHLSLFGENDNNNRILHDILEGNLPSYNIPSHQLNKCGTAAGMIVGGNMAVLNGLTGTKFNLFKPDTILFIEDIGEPIYKVERMLYNLKLSGVLPQLKGLIVGHFTNHEEPDSNGETMYDMINRMVSSYKYPVAYNFPIGHIDTNTPIIESAIVTLNVEKHFTSLSFATSL